jgi:hypothetical protein
MRLTRGADGAAAFYKKLELRQHLRAAVDTIDTTHVLGRNGGFGNGNKVEHAAEQQQGAESNAAASSVVASGGEIAEAADGDTVQSPKKTPRLADMKPLPGLLAQADHQASNPRVFPVDGLVFGMGTNLYSIYSDPEEESTWTEFNLQEAALVVSCMRGRNQTLLCQYMKARGTGVPVIATADNNKDAAELYTAGATFVEQSNFIAAKNVRALLLEESGT